MMKKHFIQNASKAAKICTIIGLVLIVCFVLAVMNDWNLYRTYLGTSFSTAGPAELKYLSDSFMFFASYRCPMFLIPTCICGLTAVILQLVPKAARKKLQQEEAAGAAA